MLPRRTPARYASGAASACITMTISRNSIAAVLLAILAGGWLALRPRPAPAPVPQTRSAAPPRPGSVQPQGRAAGAGWFDPSLVHAAPGTDPAPTQLAIFGRNGRAVDFGGKDAAQYIDERVAAARTGDLRAAYQVYQAASACAAAEEPLPEFFDPAQGQVLTRERARVRALCARVSPAQLQERMRFLARAADAGDRDAEVDFFMEGPGGKPLAGADPNDPQVQQWRQQALGYLKQAGAQCDQYALGLLSNAYDAGQLGPRDMGMAMAYSIASNAARNRPLTEQQLRERFGEELAPGDFQAALQKGAQIAAASCPSQPGA